MALNPLIYTLHDEPGTARDVARLFHYFTAAGSLVLACFAGYGSIMLEFLAPASYSAAAPLLPLVAAVLFLSAGYQFFPGLMLAKRTVIFGAIQLVGLALNLALSILLVTRFGVIGVCAASIVTALTVLIAIFVTGQRFFHVQCDWTKVFLVSGFTGLMVAVLLLQGYEEPGVRWAGYALPGVVLLLILVTGLVPRGEVTALLMRQKES